MTDMIIRVSMTASNMNMFGNLIYHAAHVMQKFPWQYSHLMGTNSDLVHLLKSQGYCLLAEGPDVFSC